MTDCAICVQPFHRVRKPVSCPRCNAVACNVCIKTYLMGNTIEPKCMSCLSAWDMEFVRANLSKAFLDGEYRKHQMDALLSEAESRVGEMQDLVPLRNRIEETEIQIAEKVQEVAACRKEIQTLAQSKWDLRLFMMKQTSTAKRILREEIRTLTQRLEEKKELRLFMWSEENELRRELAGMLYRWKHNNTLAGAEWMAAGDNIAERTKFFMACPGLECRGRLSSAYKCGLCLHWFCPDCHGDKGLDRDLGTHTCSRDDKETVTLLKQNTKPCPKCHEGIFKVSGCDQMWCTQCHTCFSWTTGKILNGVVHNPHFYAWQRDQNGGEAPRVPGDQPCGGFPPFYHVRALIDRFQCAERGNFVERTHRLSTYLLDMVIPDLIRSLEEDLVEYRRKWGVEYLRHHISRDDWGKKLYLAMRKQERKQRVLHILQMVTEASGDVFRSWPSDDEVVVSLGSLLDYANAQIDLQNKQYGTKVQHLDPFCNGVYRVY